MMHLAHVRVPKTGSSHIWSTLLVRDHWDDEVTLCGGHFRVSEILDDHDHTWVTSVRDPYQMSISMFYMMRRHSSVPGFDANQAARVAKDPTKRNRFVHTPHYLSHLALARDPDTTVEDWLENFVPNHGLGYHFDALSPSDFDVVLHCDEMERSDMLLVNILGCQQFPWHENVNPNKTVGARYPEAQFTEAMFRKRNELEYEMFDLGMERFHALCKQHGV